VVTRSSACLFGMTRSSVCFFGGWSIGDWEMTVCAFLVVVGGWSIGWEVTRSSACIMAPN